MGRKVEVSFEHLFDRNEVNGQFSPDGRWIAYQSDESTREQIYVQGFLNSSGKFQISTNGGSRPRWRRDGTELFYLSPDRKMIAVAVKATATTFEAARPGKTDGTSTHTKLVRTHPFGFPAEQELTEQVKLMAERGVLALHAREFVP
jgi:hypothetical protein